MSMDKVSFQNGFLAGMATKGLVRSGELYKPIIWNDEGVYTYFYIDFRRAMEPFSVGMMYESIIVADTAQLTPTAVAYVSPGVYKITVDLSTCTHGVTVLNKKTSLLRFANNEQLPVFSVSFYLAGMTTYLRTDYAYDQQSFAYPFSSINEPCTLIDASAVSVDGGSYYDSTSKFADPYSSINDTATVVLT